MNRALCDHQANDANRQIAILVMDAPGAGGANHIYDITNVLCEPPALLCRVGFQYGPVGEAGINGVTQEALLAIVADRLRSFQSGAFACRENAVALTHIETAMLWLHKRTLDRQQRGVEGTNEI